VQDRDGTLIRRRLVCRGVVQGVGFRPAVYRLGKGLGLVGSVRNDGQGATIEVQGDAAQIAAFEAQLPRGLPPLARLTSVEATTVGVEDATDFVVAPTFDEHRGEAMVPADAALCASCRADMEDQGNRRFHYPFTTCSDCGPRFSLVRSLPYDRERTAMACFPLCAACAAEYRDPSSRRFGAEPICCPDCGPRLWLGDAEGHEVAGPTHALVRVRELLAGGAIVAIKGLGGFQLACRADGDETLAKLRVRKQRPRKPFAVMVRDLATARQLVQLSAQDEELLQSAVGPIVLGTRRSSSMVCGDVAPGLSDLGVMLPTTGLHVELFRGAAFDALVMTSGNRSDEPICLGNREAVRRLAGLADGFLLHDRDILRRVDDSVVRASSTGPMMVRRSRGHAPVPVHLPVAVREPVLALGGHLQVTACLAMGSDAFLSQHIGDLDSEGARGYLREVVEGLEQFLEGKATTIVCDTHPDYPSAWLAMEFATQRRARLLRVPHHLAHAAAVLAEHDAFPCDGEFAAALILDGTGHGPDGSAWGSELLLVDGQLQWGRAAYGEALPLVGGEMAVREPWRIAVAVLARAGLGDRCRELPLAAHITEDQMLAMAELSLGRTWPLAHGAGRLFEAAGALLGVCARNDYEGEAAARCEALAATCTNVRIQPWPEVVLTPGRPEMPQGALLVSCAARLLAGEAATDVALGLHRTFAALWVDLVTRQLPAARTVAIGGGCLVNRLLRKELTRGFHAAGRSILVPRVLPPGDGGLAYGQCVVAAAALARDCFPEFVFPFAEV
jgi:hydrogenase maturation protein HypF